MKPAMKRIKACQNRVNAFLLKTDLPMRPVGNNVFSLLGFQIYELPEIPDRRGPKTVFSVSTSRSHDDVIPVCGTRVAFGLVIHRSIAPNPGLCKWVISEPTTGRAVAWGDTRKHALDDLSMRVAFRGGESAFVRVLNEAITRVNNSRTNHHG